MNEELEKLLEHCVEYASDLLTETGESYPFGGFIDTIGNVHPMEMEIDKKNIPTIGKVVDTLRMFGEEEMAEKRMHAYAVTYEAAVEISDTETQDCIAIDMKHMNEEAPVFYLPFTKGEERTEIGEIFAVKR